jgi:hypothetical protein
MIDTRPLNRKTLHLINLIGKKLLDFKVPLAQLDEEMIRQRAIENTGLDDFGPVDYNEAFRLLLDSGKCDANFHFFGQLAFSILLTKNLTNRLLLIEKMKLAPDIFQKPVRKPIIIIGLPRSGTTFLHRLLDLDPNLKAPQFWEVMRPIPLETPDRRYQKAKRELSISGKLYRDHDRIHYTRAHTPEECVMYLASTFFSMAFWTFAPLYRYIDWYIKKDRAIPYQEYKWFIQLLQETYPDKNLLLKAPAHMGSLDQILKNFPSARIIQTHRNPVSVINSINSLRYSTHIRVTNTYDVLRTAELTTQLWEKEIQRNLEARQANPGIVYDVHYQDLIADPLRTIRGIYNNFDLPWTEDHHQILKIGIQNNPKNRFGTHKYASEDFGTSDQEILERFKTYCEAFGYPRDRI